MFHLLAQQARTHLSTLRHNIIRIATEVSIELVAAVFDVTSENSNTSRKIVKSDLILPKTVQAG